jgi:phosphoribosylformimino-5-aminoimidazole carboxamide ribotide isomerase
VRAVAAETGLPVQASGGIRTRVDAEALLAAGADRVVVGTAAWPDPTPWLDLGERLVLAVDVRDGAVRSDGWTKGAGLTVDEALARSGDARLLVTAIDRDGTLAGPDVELVRRAAEGRRVLAAGGVRSPADVEALAAAGAEAAIVGRALLREA